MPDHECVKEKELATIFTTLTFMSQMLEDIKNNDLKHIYEVLDDVRDKLSNRRPTYTISMIIAALSSACVGLLVALVKRG